MAEVTPCARATLAVPTRAVMRVAVLILTSVWVSNDGKKWV